MLKLRGREVPISPCPFMLWKYQCSSGHQRKTGYGNEELQSVPEGANLGLGCWNPIARAIFSFHQKNLFPFVAKISI